MKTLVSGSQLISAKNFTDKNILFTENQVCKLVSHRQAYNLNFYKNMKPNLEPNKINDCGILSDT